jgi:diguanylate cyclase (GGDEF)-like protein
MYTSSEQSAESRDAAALKDRRWAGIEALAVGAVIATIVTTAVAGMGSFAKHSLETNYQAQLTALAEAAALQVDPNLHRQIRQGGERQLEYLWAVEPLRRMQKGVPGIRYIHTLAVDGDRIRVVLDAAEGYQDDADNAVDESQFADLNVGHQAAKLAALGWNGAKPRAGSTVTPYRDSRGAFMTGYAPIMDRSGNVEGVVALDFDAADYVAHFAEGRDRMIRSMLPAALMVLVLTYIAFGIRWRARIAAREAAQGATAARLAARQDKLTGLANRTAFVEQLQQHVADVRDGTGPAFAVMFLDFDHFKYVNDTLGHDAGDELLRQIAQRLRTSLGAHAPSGPERRHHVVARFGGDEFVILLDDMASEEDARTAADQLIRDLAPTYTLRGVDVSSTASIGIVHSAAADDEAETMLTNSDVAMYEAKRSGRGCYVVFDDAMRRRITRVLQLERSLLGAIGTPQVRLTYQPVVELDSGRLVAVEALLRWNHPMLGEVPPAEFVAMAEDTGLIVPLGEWVINEACRQLAEWQHDDPVRAPQAISVNVSAAELALGPRFVERVRNALAAAGLAAHGLQIEIPERDLVRDSAATKTLLEQLRAVGVRLAMDEFGTGPGSLAALSSWPFDSVKMARSFVHGLATNRDVMALAHATLTLVENLGMSSVAQGVEDPAQLAILQSFGCRYAQGRLLGVPVEASDVINLGGSIPLERLDIADAVLTPKSAA